MTFHKNSPENEGWNLNSTLFSNGIEMLLFNMQKNEEGTHTHSHAKKREQIEME